MEIFDEVWIVLRFIQSSQVLEESGLLKGPEECFVLFFHPQATNWTSVSFKLTVRQNKILRVMTLRLVKVILIRFNNKLQKSSPNGNHSRHNLHFLYLSFWNLWGLGTSCLSWSFSNIQDFLSLLAFIAGETCLRTTPQIHFVMQQMLALLMLLFWSF